MQILISFCTKDPHDFTALRNSSIHFDFLGKMKTRQFDFSRTSAYYFANSPLIICRHRHTHTRATHSCNNFSKRGDCGAHACVLANCLHEHNPIPIQPHRLTSTPPPLSACDSFSQTHKHPPQNTHTHKFTTVGLSDFIACLFRRHMRSLRRLLFLLLQLVRAMRRLSRRLRRPTHTYTHTYIVRHRRTIVVLLFSFFFCVCVRVCVVRQSSSVRFAATSQPKLRARTYTKTRARPHTHTHRTLLRFARVLGS